MLVSDRTEHALVVFLHRGMHLFGLFDHGLEQRVGQLLLFLHFRE